MHLLFISVTYSTMYYNCQHYIGDNYIIKLLQSTDSFIILNLYLSFSFLRNLEISLLFEVTFIYFNDTI